MTAAEVLFSFIFYFLSYDKMAKDILLGFFAFILGSHVLGKIKKKSMAARGCFIKRKFTNVAQSTRRLAENVSNRILFCSLDGLYSI